MKKIILCIMLSFLLLSGCSKDETDAVKFKKEYESLNGKESASGEKYISVDIDKKNIIKYSTIPEVVDVIKNGTGVIYLGYPECPWCRNAILALLEAADSTSLEKILYVNMHDVRDRLALDENNEIVSEETAKDGYFDLVNALESILDDYVLVSSDGTTVNTGEKRIYVPTVVFVRDGAIVGYHMDTVPSHDNPYIVLDDKQMEELVDIYKNNILNIKDSSCDDNHC